MCHAGPERVTTRGDEPRCGEEGKTVPRDGSDDRGPMDTVPDQVSSTSHVYITYIELTYFLVYSKERCFLP